MFMVVNDLILNTFGHTAVKYSFLPQLLMFQFDVFVLMKLQKRVACFNLAMIKLKSDIGKKIELLRKRNGFN